VVLDKLARLPALAAPRRAAGRRAPGIGASGSAGQDRRAAGAGIGAAAVNAPSGARRNRQQRGCRYSAGRRAAGVGDGRGCGDSAGQM